MVKHAALPPDIGDYSLHRPLIVQKAKAPVDWQFALLTDAAANPEHVLRAIGLNGWFGLNVLSEHNTDSVDVSYG
jgi:hypothetical protein